MRLESHDDAAIEAALGRVEGCLDLGGVMAVVVDDHDVALLSVARARGLAYDREAALHAVEAPDRFADDIERHLELVGHRDHAERVEHVVMPGIRTVNWPSDSPRRNASKCVSRPENSGFFAR